MPIHGEYRMMKMHTELAVDCDVPQENTFILGNGDVLALTADSARQQDVSLQAMFTSMEVELVTSETLFLRDRRMLSEDGLVIVVATIDTKKNRVVSGPDIISRGFVYMRESGVMIHEAQRMLSRQLQSKLANSPANIACIKN